MPAGAVAATGVATTLLAGALLALSPRPFTLCLDNAGLFQGQTLEAWRAWSAGRLPQWSDAFWGGFPLIGDGTAGGFYPPGLFAFALTAPSHLRAFDVAMALHLGLLAAGGTWLLGLLGARGPAARLGGFLTALCPVVHWFGTVSFPVLGAQAWWPWALGAAELLARPTTPAFGRALGLGWLALAAQVYVGVPEQATYCGGAAALWLLCRRTGLAPGPRLGRLALLAAGAAALAAPQLVPTAAYFTSTNRVEAPAASTIASLWLTDPMALVVAGWGVQSRFPSFFGLATLGLALVAVLGRRPRPLVLAALAVGGFLLALGPQTPLYGLVARVPPFDHFRSPVKYDAFAELGVAWLAALGLDRVLAGGRTLVAGLLAAAMVGEHLVYVAQEVPGMARTCLEVDDAEATLRTLAATRLAAPPPAGQPPPPVLDLYAGSIDTFARNLSAVVGMASLTGGRVSLLSRRHEALLVFRPPTRARLDLLGARYVLVRAGPCRWVATRLGLPVVDETPAACVLENTGAPPRYEMLHGVRPVDSEDALVDATLAYDGGAVPVLLPSGTATPRDGGGGTVRVLDYLPGRVRLEVDARDAGLLLVRHSWVRGWEATVDGRPAPTVQAAGLYFALPVPAGRHEVRLRYHTPGLGAGLAIAVAWLGLVGGWRLARRHSRLSSD